MRYSILGKLEEDFEGLAVDIAGTNSCEDCFSFDIGKNGDILLKIMAVIPPFEKVDCNNLSLALKRQCETSSPHNEIPFFDSYEKSVNSLQLMSPRKVLVAKYHFNYLGQLKKQGISLGTAYLTSQHSYQSYEKEYNVDWHIHILKQAFKGIPHLETMFMSWYVEKLTEEKGLGCKFVFGALQLFNHTCRNVAKRNNVPFVCSPDKWHKAGFRIGRGYAQFSGALRKPCSYINMLIMYYFLSKKSIILTQEELTKFLPQ